MPAASELTPIILAGGGGTRLAPLSTEDDPKQFLDLLGTGRSLLEETLRRALRCAAPERIFTLAPLRHAARTHSVLRRLHPALARNLILEPSGRNTAPAAIAAALAAPPDATLTLLPCDHWIESASLFRAALRRAEKLAADGRIVLFGARAHAPEPGLGYIITGKSIGNNACHMERFVEKPSPEAAAALLATGDAFWNCGIFTCTAATLLAEAARHAPHMLAGVREAWRGRLDTPHGILLARTAWDALAAAPLDKAVIEKSLRLAMLPARFGWEDIGTWDGLARCRNRLQKAGEDINIPAVTGK